MNTSNLKALVLQDPGKVGISARRLLTKSQSPLFDAKRVDSVSDVLDAMETSSLTNGTTVPFDVVLLDLDGLKRKKWSTIEKLRKRYPQTAILALGRQNQPSMAIKALKKGAQDFLAIERLRTGLLIESVMYAIERVRGQHSNVSISAEPTANMRLRWIIHGNLARARGPHLGAPETIKRSVDAWLTEAEGHGMRSILCMLDSEELKLFYSDIPGGLLTYYKHNGFSVGHVSVPDFCMPPLNPRQCRKTWKLYKKLPKPVLVHCRHGIARSWQASDYIKHCSLKDIATMMRYR